MTIRSTDILSLALMLPVSPDALRGGAASGGAQPGRSPRKIQLDMLAAWKQG